MDYEIKEYRFSATIVRYTIIKEDGKVFMQLLPTDCNAKIDDVFYQTKADSQFSDCNDWFAGAICHLHLSHQTISPYNNSCKLGGSYDDMYFKSQNVTTSGAKTVIETVMTSDEGYDAVHRLINYDGENGFTVECEFVNNSDRDFRIEMISSASLDGLSPYENGSNSENINIHMFRSGWATEGKHVVYPVSELNLEKSWGGNFISHKIGTQGSRSTSQFYPYAAVEDTKRGVMWGMQLAHNATWQMEFSRYGKNLSFSGGIGDIKFGNWAKSIKPGESFTAPKAYIAAVCGDIADLSDVFMKMRKKEVDAYGEDGMPIAFNEWCTTWGKPSHNGNLALIDKLKNTKVKYFVMDAGWYLSGGDWQYKKESFPYGLKAYTDEVRKRGMIPGIWFEFENVDANAQNVGSEYDRMMLRHDGTVIKGQVNKSRKTKFWDFRNPEAIAWIDEHILKFLKDNGFGYLKVDYNSDIGISCDGAESGGEALRQHMEAVREYFKKIKREIPDIIIENCSSGGMRQDPSMMSVSAMCSFSDAHESFEFPVIAANLQYLVPPRQSQIWNVLHPEHDENRFAYSISAGFLGRMCWSGNFAGLSDEQMQRVYDAESLYEEVAHIIKDGKSRIYRTEKNLNFRHLKGTQAVIRYADTGNDALLVYHCFENPEKLCFEPDGEWEIVKSLYPAEVKLGKEIVIDEKKSVFGNVILLKRREQ